MSVLSIGGNCFLSNLPDEASTGILDEHCYIVALTDNGQC